MPITTRTLRPGDTHSANPFTILIVSNGALEAPTGSGTFIRDPIADDQISFDACATSVDVCLFGGLPGQAEQLLNDASVAGKIRVVSAYFNPEDEPNDADSLVGQSSPDDLLEPRKSNFVPFLNRFGLRADIVYAISASTTHMRATSLFTSDDQNSTGVPFNIDGVQRFHRQRCLIPGTVALHASAASVTPLHEFGHALSSDENGVILDLYVDSAVAINNKRGRPIPHSFASYDGVALSSDLQRDSLGYPSTWQSFHCELIDATRVALMDDYWQSKPPEASRFDAVTRKFLLDRLRCKIAR